MTEDTENKNTTEIVYYRVKQTDYDGSFKYYNIVDVNCDGIR